LRILIALICSVFFLGLSLNCAGPSDPPAESGVIGDGGAGNESPAESQPEFTKYQPTRACFIDTPLGSERPNYNPLKPKLPKHCMGTDHQDIKGIEKVVYLGDSITVGTPPTLPEQFYRNLLTKKLEEKFGKLEVKNCSKWGAETEDLLVKSKQQIFECFPDKVEKKKTLVIMTMGGNDMQAIAKKGMKGEKLEKSLERARLSVKQLKDALVWLKDPKRFPNGSYVVFGNVYEFTDGMGDTSVCGLASSVGLSGSWPAARKVYKEMNEGYMKAAIETKTDMVFMLEHFCGHGFNHDNPKNECYLGKKAEFWFDFTCIHPNPKGHAALSDMFMYVIEQ